MNSKKILKTIKQESEIEETILKETHQNKFTYLINKKIALQFHDLIVSVKMIFKRR